MYGDQFGEVVSGYQGLKGQLVRFLLVQEDLEGIRVTGYLTLSKLVLSPTYFINLSFNTENKKRWCYQSKATSLSGSIHKAHWQLHHNFIYSVIYLFIYLFIHLFNHFHHIV